ncbi:hypothetical protein ILUMI_04652 [Ignelater luminosus]|uniref:DIRP domain-containing protein n=1 Tax=Ignelater luminosus TaxID=2038154 RepID=A0A8K0GJD8_IGNLU|nr:hypothetical protein ILUMI_04652 [Ignelater luminosus]
MADELESESVAALLEFKNGRKMTNEEINVKQEVIDDDEDSNMEVDDEDVPKLGPAMLGLQRVGAPTTPKQGSSQPTQVLNARGMPARIRKKNRLYYDDDIINTPHHRIPSAKKQTPQSNKRPKTSTPTRIQKESPKPSPKRYIVNKDGKPHSTSPVPQQSPDRKIGQKIGMRLRNLLKLPKAHKWVCYEWFYSNIDRCLFAGENDFSICLKESFPELKSHELTRIEWTKIRRMMGKPRRCSQAFFNEERMELEKKRNKIRALQQRKATDMSSFKDLPPEIPMQLVIGTKVTARLRKPQDGLFTGSIDAVDTSNNTYRITFERHGLGTHSVPDYEVLSNEPPETMTTNNFQNKYRPRNGISPFSSASKSPTFSTLKNKRDPLLAGSAINKPTFSGVDGRVGGFPIKLLEKIVLVTKILTVKKAKIKLLKSMNTEAEKFMSFETLMPDDFERKYASILIDLEKLNHDLKNFLDEIQLYCQEIAPEPSVAAMLAPSHLREKCKEEAIEIVQRNNTVIAADKGPVTNESVLELITDLTALMLQVKSLSDSDQNAYELQVLQGTMEIVKRKLSIPNQLAFQNNVEVHMKHIQMGLGQASHKSISTNVTTKQ